MRFLDTYQQPVVYLKDLELEGFRNLGSSVYYLWQSLVARGFSSLSPGFLAALVDRLQGRGNAVRLPGRTGTVERINFFALPVWNQIFPIFSSAGSLADDHHGYCDRIAYLLDYFDLGRSDSFHWGVLPETESVFLSTSGYDSSSEELQNMFDAYFDEQRTALRSRSRNLWNFGMTQKLKVQRPELLSTVFLEEVHRQWDQSYISAVRSLGSIQPLTDTSDQLVKFADPHLQVTGGYSDLEVRGEGSWSALLASELAYQEDDDSIDFFDVKYLESQLLYLKKEEGVDRVIRRRIRIHIDARKFGGNVRVLARLLVWLELSVYLATHLFEKDRIQIIVQILTAQTDLCRSLNQLLLLRTRQLNSNSDGEIRFSEPDVQDGLRWQEITIGPQSIEDTILPGRGHRKMIIEDPVRTLGLTLKTHRLFVRRLLVHVKMLKNFLEGNTHAKISA